MFDISSSICLDNGRDWKHTGCPHTIFSGNMQPKLSKVGEVIVDVLTIFYYSFDVLVIIMERVHF